MSRNLMVSLAAMLLVVSLASWAADDGAALYKKKCAGVTAPAEGKAAMKAPALKGIARAVNRAQST